MDPYRQVRFGSFRLDLEQERLFEGEEPLSLTPKAFAVLAHLARHPGRQVSKEELLDAVWGERYVSDAVLKVAVREVRRTLGDDARSPRFIETLHRRGYRFIAEPATEIQPPTTAQKLATIVGREAALEQLQELLEQGLGGQRQVAFVTGEPGIGKTTLVESFLEQAIDGAGPPGSRDRQAATGHCLEQFGAGEAYMPVLEALGRLCRGPGRDRLLALLRQYAPTWLLQMPALVGREDRVELERETVGATPERMLREMAEAIEALTSETPLVLVLEDLHWSDGATLDLVSLLARRPEPARLLLIGTYRPAEAGPPLQQVRRELGTHRRCHELRLDYLDEPAVGEYLRRNFREAPAVAALAGSIHRHTEGNPLFMVNVVDYLVAEGRLVEKDGEWRLRGRIVDLKLGVPEGIRQLVVRQIERLDEPAQRILEAASVVGAEMSATGVAAALGSDPLAVEESCDRLVEQRQFLAQRAPHTLPDGSVTARYGFIHALYQQVLYERLPEARRARLHLRVGEGGERTYGTRSDEIATELAIHFERGRDPLRSVRYLQRAAETAVRRYANREASGYLRHALELVGATGPPGSHAESGRVRTELLGQRGLVRRAMGDMRGAAADFEGMVEAARELGDLDQEVRALLYLVSALYWVRRERCLEVVEQAAERSDGLADPLMRSHVKGYCAHWNLNLRGWRDGDAEAFQRALVATREAEDLGLHSLHLVRDVYFRCWQSDYEGAGRAAAEALRLALEVGDVFDYLVCKYFWGWALLHGGRWGDIGPLLRQGIEMAEKNGHGLWALIFRTELGWLHEQAFDYQEALRLCRESLERARQAPQETGQLLFKSLIVVGLAQLGLGQPEAAYRSFSEVIEVSEKQRVSMDCILYLPLHHGLGQYRLERGEYGEARREAQRLAELAAVPGERTYLALARRTLAEVAMAEEDWDEARDRLEEALDGLDDRATPLAAWRVCASAARYHRRQGRPVEAAEYSQRSAQVLRRLAAALGAEEPLRRSVGELAASV